MFLYPVPYASSCQVAFNRYRSAYGLPDLEWDGEISAGAQKWAQYLHDNRLYFTDEKTNLGETLFFNDKPGAEATCKKAAEKW